MQGNTLVKAIIAVAILIFISALALTVYKSGGAALNWQMGADDPVLKFYPSDDGIYVIGTANISLVNSSGKALWSVPFPGTAQSAYGGGRLLVYSPGAGLNAIDKDGRVTPLTLQSMNYPPIVGPDGTVYIQSYDMLTALYPSGVEKWNASNLISGPAVDDHGYVYFFMRPPEHIMDVYLDCISPDGSLKWSILYPKYTAGTKLKAAGSDGIYTYDERGGALDHISSDGTVIWDHTMPYLGQYTLVQDENKWLYMFYVFGTVHVLNEQGTLIGKFNPAISNDANLSYSSAVSNGTAYVIGDTGKDSATIYALNIDGSLKWEQAFNSTSPPSIYPGRNIICVGADTKKGPVLYVIGANGEMKFTYNSGDGTPWEQVYVDGDVIYARTHNGMLYTLKG